MADLIFPPSLLPTRVTWTLQRNVATYTSPLSYASQRNDVNRSARWRATIEMPPLAADEAALLSTWLDQISRGEHVGLVPVFQNTALSRESGFPAFVDLNSAWTAQPTLSAWTQSGLIGPAYVSNGQVAMVRAGAPMGFITRSFAVTSQLPYYFASDVAPQQTPGGVVVGNGGNTILYFDNRGAPVIGRSSGVVYSSNAAIQVTLDVSTAFRASRFASFRLHRCYITEVSAAAGSYAVQINGGDPANAVANIVRMMAAGQFFAIQSSRGWELKRATLGAEGITGSAINGVATAGSCQLSFEPALRGSVSANAGVAADQPVCRMRLATPESTAVVDAPNFSGFTFDLIEDIAP